MVKDSLKPPRISWHHGFFSTLSPPGCFSILPCCTNDLLELRIRVAPEWQLPPCPMARNEAMTRREILCITWMFLYARSIVLSPVGRKRLLKLTAFHWILDQTIQTPKSLLLFVFGRLITVNHSPNWVSPTWLSLAKDHGSQKQLQETLVL